MWSELFIVSVVVSDCRSFEWQVLMKLYDGLFGSRKRCLKEIFCFVVDDGASMSRSSFQDVFRLVWWWWKKEFTIIQLPIDHLHPSRRSLSSSRTLFRLAKKKQHYYECSGNSVHLDSRDRQYLTKYYNKLEICVGFSRYCSLRKPLISSCLYFNYCNWYFTSTLCR